MSTDPLHDSPNVPLNTAELRKLRQLAGLTQAQLAEKASVSFSYVAHIERGIRPHVSPPVFARLCDALGVQNRKELMAQVGAG